MTDTRIEGSPGSVDAAAAWLRQLGTGIDRAADGLQQSRSRSAGTWQGRGGDAYRGYVASMVSAADDHRDRARRAARVFDAYADRLTRAKQRMADLRSQASGGGLTVSGTVIEKPPPGCAPGALPGNATVGQKRAHRQLAAAFEEAQEKARLYVRLAREVEEEHAAFERWVESRLGSAVSDLAGDSADLDGLLGRLGAADPGTLAGGAFSFGQGALESRADSLARRADELVRDRSAGHPGHRAFARSPEGRRLLDRLDDLLGRTDKVGRALGPAGQALDGVNAVRDIQDGESPGRVLSSTGLGYVAGAGAVAVGVTVGAPAVVVGAGAVGTGILVSEGSKKVWDAAPDGVTKKIDGVLDDAWGFATGD